MMRVYHVPYRYVEYPKWVRLPDGREALVHSSEEEGDQLRELEQPAPRRRARRVAPELDGSDLA